MKVKAVLILTLFIASSATASHAEPENAPQLDATVLRVKLAPPARLPLPEDQIKSALSGKQLLLDEGQLLAPGIYLETVMQGGCPPVEKFYVDGTWERIVCARVLTTEKGRWVIKTDRFGSLLCTVVSGRSENCRAVWRRSSPDRLILTVRGRVDGDPDYNPYRTAPI